MKLEILVTTFKKKESELFSLCANNNYSGFVFIGNQNGENSTKQLIKTETIDIRVSNINTIGVSRNRNYLINNSKAEYVLFLDDDAILNNNSYKDLLSIIDNFLIPQGVLFCKLNVTCDDPKRQIKQLKTKKRVGFKSLSSFGVIGLIANRRYIIENNLLFEEQIGPGCLISSGEDTVFYKKICKATKKISTINFHVARIPVTNSSWFNGYDKQYFINKGYCARVMYGRYWFLPFLFSCLKHIRLFTKNTPFVKQIEYGKSGAKIQKQAQLNKNDIAF